MAAASYALSMWTVEGDQKQILLKKIFNILFLFVSTNIKKEDLFEDIIGGHIKRHFL